MTPKLSLPNEYTPTGMPFFKEFHSYGRDVGQMPKLIAEGRIPMNVAQLMQRRLDVRNYPEDVKTNWMDNYFNTGDAIAYHPDGRVKIVRDSQTLREMTPDTPRNCGNLVLTEDIYNALEGKEFKKGKLGKVNTSLSKKDVKTHPVWRILARDQTLLDDYADYIFAEGKHRVFSYNTVRGVYVYHDSAKDNPRMRSWGLRGLGCGSLVFGRSVFCPWKFAGYYNVDKILRESLKQNTIESKFQEK